MPDLIITLNTSASKKNEFIILETYYTKQVIVNKSGKYKGSSITVADVLNCMSVNNCQNQIIKKLFSEMTYQISLNSFYVSIDNFKKIHNILKNNQMFFLDNTDKSLTIIRTINEDYISRKTKYKYQIGNSRFLYYNDNSIFIESIKDIKVNISQSTPIPHLYFSDEEQLYLLFFDYYGNEVAYLDKKVSIKVNDIIYLRNFKFENKTMDELLEDKFVKLAKNRFIYSGVKNKSEINLKLTNKGIVLQNDKNFITPNIKIVNYNSDWFEIDLSCTIGSDIINLASKIQLFSQNNEMKLQDKKVILPDCILQAKDNIISSSDRLLINKKHIFQLLRIIYESKSSITDFFSYSDIELILPEHVENIAYKYQLEGIKWIKFLFLNRFGGCLADDMGLGKTFQVIGFLQDKEVRKYIKSVLIVVPKSLIINWKKEFDKFSSDYKVAIYHGDKRREIDFANYDVIITTYNTALIDLDYLNKNKYSVVIFDEIQTVKNYKSITSDAMKTISADIKIGLSGTPMENNISELWNIMDILNTGVFSTHNNFLRRYNGKNYDELKTILNFFIMRRMKKNVLKELPPKYEQIIYCNMDSSQRNLYTSITIAVKSEIMKLKAFAAPVVLKGLTLLRECCCHPLLLNDNINIEKVKESCKLDALNILIENLFKSQHKILIFSNYTSMLQLIKFELEKIDSYRDFIFYLDGKTKNRNELIEKFESSDLGIFLISIKAGGVGLNLISAQDVIIYDPWWNPFVEQQAIDRAYRIGQNQSVNVYKLVAANTIEEKIIEMQKNKQKEFSELIDGISTNKNIDLNEIINLL